MSRWRRWISPPDRFVAAALLCVVTLAALTSPFLGLPDPNEQRLAERLEPPFSLQVGTGTSHWLGTDHLGRDMLSRILSGARVSGSISIPAVLVAVLVGGLLGIVSGYRRGVFEAVIMRAVEVQLSFPFLVLALLLITVVGRGLATLVLAFAISDWAIYARTSHADSIAVRSLPFVDAARAVGVSDPRMLLRHVLPNASTSIIVLATLALGRVMVGEASLSFLGLGAPPSTPSWGSVIADGRDYLNTAWWISTLPGLLLLLVVLAINTLGDAIRDALDPRLRTAEDANR